jgi:hypothetical protein
MFDLDFVAGVLPLIAAGAGVSGFSSASPASPVPR